MRNLARVVVAGAVVSIVLGACHAESPPADSAVTTAYRQFKDAAKVFDCVDAYDTVLAAGQADAIDVPRLRRAAREYSHANSAYVGALDAIGFPDPARAIAVELRRAVTDEIEALELLSGVSRPADAYPLLNHVYYGEAAFGEITDRLREALGNPVPQATRALSQFEFARQTAKRDDPTIGKVFEAAVAAADLEAAKEVKRVERQRLTEFRDALDTIDFPDSFDARVAELKARIEDSIAFSARQVDVSDGVDIVPTPPSGGAEFQARQAAAATLATELAEVDPPQSTAPAC